LPVLLLQIGHQFVEIVGGLDELYREDR
jgi:hypothetical protein